MSAYKGAKNYGYMNPSYRSRNLRGIDGLFGDVSQISYPQKAAELRKDADLPKQERNPIKVFGSKVIPQVQPAKRMVRK